MPSRFHSEKRFKGLPLSQGVAVARVCLFNEKRHSNLPVYRVEGEGPEREHARLKRALEIAAGRLEAIRADVLQRIGPAEAEIFTAQKLILADPQLLKDMARVIDQGSYNAEAAVMQVLDAYEARLLEVDNEYIKERASDFGEVKRRLLDVLANMNPSLQCAGEAYCQRGKDRIVVAEELTPTLAVDLDAANTLGFVTERGGANAHAAILARALGIPAVSGIKDIHNGLSCGTEVLINGTTGEVVIWPTEETVRRARAAHDGEVSVPRVVEPVPGLKVLANISTAGDLDEVLAMQAEGIGLYRTEFEFMAAGRRLSEDDQYERYAEVVRAMAGRPVSFRLLDIGGDKQASFLAIPEEDNPALGLRGSRLLLGHPDLLREQARALVRASAHGPVWAMYPMVVDLDQFRALRRVFEGAVKDLPRGDVKHGLMLEVPSACLQANELLQEADFASIGTNDLTQYLFAVDRNNELVADDYNPDRPVFWALVGRLVEAASAAGKPLSVCGELAGDPRHVARLHEAGIRAVSVSPRLIPGVRHAAGALGAGLTRPGNTTR